jgi:iron complex outermembrane recepter protein
MTNATMRPLVSGSITMFGVLLLASPPGFAGTADADTSDSASLQEIVVTAQRKAENLLDVPLSISAVSGDELNASGIKSLTDLQFIEPGYVVADSAGYTQIFVRGVGNSIFSGADPSVATFIDDVPRIFGSLVNNLVDVDRIELLKGAQGGLYGRNATGGVLNIVTRQPDTREFSGNALLDYGEDNTFRAAGYVNIPISDNVAWNIAAERDSHDNYVRNISTDPTPYSAANFPGGSLFGSAQATANFLNSGIHPPSGYADGSFSAVDSKLLLKPLEHLKITVAGDYSIKTDSNGSQFYNATPSFAQATLTGFLGAFIGATPNFAPNAFVGSSGKFTASGGLPYIVNEIDTGGSVTAVYSLPHVDITSISAYRAQRTAFLDDVAAIAVPVITPDVNNHKWYAYQELRAISTDEGPLHLLGGATYLRTRFGSEVNLGLILPVIPYMPSDYEVDVVNNWTVYLQAGYDLTQALNLTVSGRYFHEQNRGTFDIPPAPDAVISEKKFIPSATLSYKLQPDGTIYVRWARGFKAGGINPSSPPIDFTNPNEGAFFGGETVDTYEAGYRSALLDHRIDLTTAVFYNDYRGLQVNAHANAENPEISEGIVNAGSARTWGAEEQLNWRVVRPVTVGLAAGYLSAKYTNFVLANSPQLVPFDLSGQSMPNAPKWQLSYITQLDQPITDNLHLTGNLMVSYLSRDILASSGLPGVLPDAVQPSYAITNLRVGVRTADGRYSLDVFANNLFDRAYTVYGTSSASSGNLFSWGNPRIVGGELNVRF